MTKRETLLHLSPLAARGGCEVNCLRIIEALPEYRHVVVVFGQRGPMTDMWLGAGATVEHLDAWECSSLNFARTLVEWRRKQTVVPMGVFYWSTSRLPFVLRALRSWNGPWVVHLGNPISSKLAMRMRLRTYEWLTHPPANITLAACSQYVANSHRTSSYYRRFPIKVIYNAISPAFDYERRHRPLPLGSQPVIGMVARLDPIKDHATLLRAVAIVVKTRPDVQIELAGDGLLRGGLEEQAQSLGIASHVRFLGSVSDVAERLRHWDIFVHSTTADEGMGTGVAEAMMSGLPCVLSDLPMLREVGGDAGAIYVRAGDAAHLATALIRLTEDVTLRHESGIRAKDRAGSLFDRTIIGQEYLRAIMP